MTQYGDPHGISADNPAAPAARSPRAIDDPVILKRVAVLKRVARIFWIARAYADRSALTEEARP